VKKYAVYCPSCGTELYFDARTSGAEDYLLCNNSKCFKYFSLKLKTNELKELGSHQETLDQMSSMGLTR